MQDLVLLRQYSLPQCALGLPAGKELWASHLKLQGMICFKRCGPKDGLKTLDPDVFPPTRIGFLREGRNGLQAETKRADLINCLIWIGCGEIPPKTRWEVFFQIVYINISILRARRTLTNGGGKEILFRHFFFFHQARATKALRKAGAGCVFLLDEPIWKWGREDYGREWMLLNTPNSFPLEAFGDRVGNERRR